MVISLSHSPYLAPLSVLSIHLMASCETNITNMNHMLKVTYEMQKDQRHRYDFPISHLLTNTK